ncbi:hypothetical protein GH714_011875 [Hevea brasiliensis]|uniref:DUF659 domain-containing protein n=1 Tax=Hevea brasiliensis TaxID=3981 RepID=A0A6A6KN04_HEVBR|nr:hypothetical protein GH714_011875 [Hevea brasiliensis]
MKDRVRYDKVRRIVEEAEKSGVSSSLKNSTISTKPKPIIVKANPIASAFNVMERDIMDLKVMRVLCANGIPFNVLQNPQFCEMVIAINNAPKGYKAPSYAKARIILLDECKIDVEKHLALVKDTCREAMFMYADDFSGIEKIGNAIVEYLLKAIEEVGLFNVLQVITNNASNCKAARKEIEKALATTIVLKSWKEWMKNGDKKMRTMGALVVETISDDDF